MLLENAQLSFPFYNQPPDIILTFLNQSLFLPFNDQVILYSGDRAYVDYYAPMKGRVNFNSADPKNGDASINVTGLKSSDSGTYQCKVKKAPGIRSRKMLLIVMGRWSGRYSRKHKPVVLGQQHFSSSQGKFSLSTKWKCTQSHALCPPWQFDVISSKSNDLPTGCRAAVILY